MDISHYRCVYLSLKIDVKTYDYQVSSRGYSELELTFHQAYWYVHRDV